MKTVTEEDNNLKKMKTTIYNEDEYMSGIWPTSNNPMTPGIDNMINSGFAQSGAY